MTQALLFPSEDALRVAIAGALVPPEVLSSPAEAWSGADGELWIRPAKPIAREALRKLAAAGVEARPKAAPPAEREPRSASCWAELVRVRREADPEAGRGAVLFVTERPAAMLEAAAEMLRLGCDRQAYAAADGVWLLRVGSPPYYTLARAMERRGELRAFAPSPPGQGAVWVELGYGHPLAAQIRPEPGTLVLIGGDGGWTVLADGAWTEIDHALDVAVPSPAARIAPAPLPARVKVTLRLARAGRSLPAALWVVRKDAPSQVERMVASVPDEVLDDLLFAVAGEPGDEIVVLRARAGARRHVEPQLQAEAYAKHPAISNLFLPCASVVEPPLRRDIVRELCAPDADDVTWLCPVGDGAFRPERIAESAFQPLRGWVDYVVDRSAAELAPWVRSAAFELEAFEVAALPPDAAPRRRGEPDEPERPRARASSARQEPERAPEKPKTSRAAAATPAPAAPLAVPEERAPDALVQDLAAAEREMLELDVPLDDPRRTELWARLGELDARLGRAREAGLCWTRALWEHDAGSPEADRLAAAWARSEGAGGGARDEARLLAIASPGRDEVRALVALVVAASGAGARVADPPAVARWLDRHDDSLDVRSLWLGRVALSRLAGGDALTLARARDRILGRLHRGLSVERDVPMFLRFAGQGAAQTATTERLRAELDKLATLFVKTKRKQAPIEADPRLTRAYVELVLAYGFARLGDVDRARSLAAAATAALDLAEPVHGFLGRAYAARVAQAIEGLAPETPLPADVAARLNELDRFQRYKVDRLRQFSAVLEPQESLDPVVAYQRGEADPRGPEFAPLRGMQDVEALAAEVARIVQRAAKSEPDERARLFDGAMDFFPMLPSGEARRLLDQVIGGVTDVPPLRRARLLEEALMLSGHFGLEGHVRSILAALEPILAGLGAEHAAEIAAMTGGALRTLRRVGLRDEAAALLDATAARASGKGTAMLLARVHLGAGLAHLGRFDRARPLLEEALGVLGAAGMPMSERLELTRGLARALGQAPEAFAVAALGKLAQGLAGITDSFNTNSHFCLSVVSFMESLVLGYASEDLALGEQGRQWLDEDEYLIRRRIHRELLLP